jgi:hypothetical protein
MQYGDATGAADAYASAAHVTSKTLLVQLQKVDGFFRRHPVIQDSTRHGARATVYLVARGLSQDKSGHSIRTEQPLALTLVRQGGNWLLADNLLVQQVVGSHP